MPEQLDKMLEQVPEQFRPIVAKYGPALAAMTAEEFCAWVELLILGKPYEAWQNVAEKLGNADLLSAWRAVGEKWDEANRENRAKLKLQRDATMAVLKVLLVAALGAVGL